MANFEFSFLVSGVDPHAENFADRFYEAGCDDATLMLTRGLIAVCFAREAENYTQAVISGLSDVWKTGACIERFEPDFLVSRSEIAARAGISKAAVSLYVSGERGEGFPAPYARITSSNPLWDWVEVSTWLHKAGQLRTEAVVNARVSRVVNWFVQTTEKIHSPEKLLITKMQDAAKEPVFC